MKKPTNAIVRASSGPAVLVDTNVPKFLQTAPGPKAGLENVESRDMTVPRLALCQSMTPERKKTDPKYIPGLEEGEYFNTITKKVYGTKVEVIPLFFYKSRIRFNPIDEGGGIRCQAQDGRHGLGDPGGNCETCKFGQFSGDGDRPECDHFYNYAVLIVDGDNPVDASSLAVRGFKSSGIKVAKEWNANMRLQNLDAFARVYELTSVEAKNSQGSWYQSAVKNLRFVSEKEYQLAGQVYLSVREAQKAGTLKVDLAEEEVDEPGAKAPF